MSTLVELGWIVHLATTSAGLYHSDTHTLVRAILMHGRYYVKEHDMSCLLLRNTCESNEAANAAHTGGSENRDHNEEVPSLVDVAYDEAEEHGNQLPAASLEVWNTGEHYSDLLTRKIIIIMLLIYTYNMWI